MVSTADYLAFLDDDDLRLPGSLDLQLAALKAHPEAGFACGAMLIADQQYQLTGEVSYPRQAGGDAFWDLLELDFPVMPLSTLSRKDCLLSVGLLSSKLSGIDDWDIFVRIAELYPVVVMIEPMGIYRQPTSTSGQGSSAQSLQLLRAARHQLKLLQLPRAVSASSRKRRAIRRRTVNRLADTLLSSAAQQILRGEHRSVLPNTLAALRLNPLRVARPHAYQKMLSRWIAAANIKKA
jgi:hypothetical protein